MPANYFNSGGFVNQPCTCKSWPQIGPVCVSYSRFLTKAAECATGACGLSLAAAPEEAG